MSGGKALGCWLFSGNSINAEVIGLAGYDFIIIDHEHGPGDFLGAIAQFQALSATSTTGLIRVPWNDAVYIKRALDTGAEGIMIPMIESRDEAEDAVRACMYPPEGVRGCASSLIRGSGYGHQNARYLEEINDEILVMLQIESPKAIENIPEIAAVEGVDVLFIGPNDLAASVGRPGDTEHPESRKLISRAEEAIKRSGKKMAAVPYGGMSWMQMFELGYDLIAGNSDVNLMREGALSDVRMHRKFHG